jgi:hypothetical protein
MRPKKITRWETIRDLTPREPADVRLKIEFGVEDALQGLFKLQGDLAIRDNFIKNSFGTELRGNNRQKNRYV